MNIAPAHLSPRDPKPAPSTIPATPTSSTTQSNPNAPGDAGKVQPHKHRHNHPTKSWLNLSFLAANLFILAFSFIFLYEFIIVSPPSFWVPALVIYILLFILTYWSYWMTVCVAPGSPPFYYGLSPEIGPLTPRKYCILCHNFKPDRTHHCSTCKTCVLNMDHHCPWVNNCIGFRNRKYFILFLVYISLGLVFASIIEVVVLISTIQKVVMTKETDIHFALKTILTLTTIALSFALVSFTVFHVKMVLENTTTLEGMIRKKNLPDSESTPDYDIGKT